MGADPFRRGQGDPVHRRGFGQASGQDGLPGFLQYGADGFHRHRMGELLLWVEEWAGEDLIHFGDSA